jgi:hypothetical protein
MSNRSHRGAAAVSLRHPFELPFYAFMVALNILIIALILQLAIVLPFLPDALRGSGWAVAVRAAVIGLLLLVPVLVVVRETQRASVRATAVELSPSQYGELYRTADDFADKLTLHRRPQIYLANGNGTLNAFAAQATGHDYIVRVPGAAGSHRSGAARLRPAHRKTTSTSRNSSTRDRRCVASGSGWPNCPGHIRSRCAGWNGCTGSACSTPASGAPKPAPAPRRRRAGAHPDAGQRDGEMVGRR